MSNPRFIFETTPTNPDLLRLDSGETEYYKHLTKIQDEEQLRKHIIDVQRKASKVYGYPCIQGFRFTKLKISRQPVYRSVLRLVKERPGAILLDVGCCFGNDVRKAVSDGWPVDNVVGTDIEPAFWNYGHDLFRSTPDTFRAPFIAGDIFNSDIVHPREPFYSASTTGLPNDLRNLKSLTPLQGHVAAIHASWVFHLFVEERQLELAKRLASLLSPEPGSVIFGSHVGQPVRSQIEIVDYGKHKMFCHSPDSWRDLWDGEVFQKGSVRVDVELVGHKFVEVDFVQPFLVWSVIRL